MKRYFVLAHEQARRSAAEACYELPAGYVVTIAPPTRNLEQNARLHAMLNEVSQQVIWHGNHLTAEEWKRVFTASLKKQKVVPDLDGSGFVVIGVSTSSMSKHDMAELITLIEAFGAEKGVVFNEN